MSNDLQRLNLIDIWNRVTERDFGRALVKRDYMWASEIGGAYADRFLKMAAVPYTNPPNARSQRKFKAGNVWEWLLYHLLDTAGLLIESQQEVWSNPIHGGLLIKGKIDFLVGGNANKKKVDAEMIEIEDLEMKRHFQALPDFMYHVYNELLTGLQYEETVVECKSCSAYMMDKYEQTNKPNPHHVAQLFHYAHNLQKPGLLIYISKDDCRMRQFYINPNDEGIKAAYEMDNRNFTNYYLRNERPPLELPLTIDSEGYYSKNWRIEYSNYLTMLYGYETPGAYRDDWEKKVQRWNRIIKREKDGKKMTADNLLGIREMEKYKEQYGFVTNENWEA